MDLIAIISEDHLLRQRALEDILSVFVQPEDRPLNVTYLDGSNANAYEVTCFLRQAPMGADRRVVVVKNPEDMGAKQLSPLSAELTTVPDSACLVLLSSSTKKDAGLGAKMSAAVKSMGKTVRPGGETKYDRLDVAEDFIRRMLQGTTVTMSDQIISSLVERLGTDSQILRNEVSKLIDYVGTGAVTHNVVELIVTLPAENIVFKLVDAAVVGDVIRANDLARRLCDASEDPTSEIFRVLALVRRQLLLVWQAKLLLQRKVDLSRGDTIPIELLAMIPEDQSIVETLKKSPWLAKKLVAQARTITWSRLTAALTYTRNVPEIAKTNNYVPEPTIFLQVATIQLCGFGGRKGAFAL